MKFLLSIFVLAAASILCVLAGSPEEEAFCGEYHKACQTTAQEKCSSMFQGYSMESFCKANFDKKTKVCRDYETRCDCTYAFTNKKESHSSEALQIAFTATNNTCSTAKAIQPTQAGSLSATPTSGCTKTSKVFVVNSVLLMVVSLLVSFVQL